jgi:hypothetical protein
MSDSNLSVVLPVQRESGKARLTRPNHQPIETYPNKATTRPCLFAQFLFSIFAGEFGCPIDASALEQAVEST